MPSSLFVLPMQSFTEMPVWARLDFANMISTTYSLDDKGVIPLTVQDAIVEGFKRVRDTVWVYYRIVWPDQTALYMCPLEKFKDDRTLGENVFREERDGVLYHLCSLPKHLHYIPVQFAMCYDEGAWTWESVYAS